MCHPDLAAGVCTKDHANNRAAAAHLQGSMNSGLVVQARGGREHACTTQPAGAREGVHAQCKQQLPENVYVKSADSSCLVA